MNAPVRPDPGPETRLSTAEVPAAIPSRAPGNAEPAPQGRGASSAPAAPRRSLIRHFRALLLLVLLGAGAVGGTWWWTVARFIEATDNAYVQGDIAALFARIEGDVAEILVADNQAVRAGDSLIRLEDRDWRARLAQAEASVTEAQAAVATLRDQAAQQRAQIAAAEAQVTSAQAERERAAAESRRSSQLAGSGYSSRQAQEKAVADLRKAEAALAAAEAQANAQRLALPVIEAQRAQAEARRESAEAAVALARSNLEDTVIRAPFDGRVGNRAAQVGEHVRPGQRLIAIAPPPERQWVVANFKETQLGRMRPGQPVHLSVDALPGIELHGRVESIAPATGSQFSLLPPENATGNFTKIVQRVPVRVTLETEDAERLALLRPGLSVEAEVDTRADPTAPRSPFAAAAATLGGLLN